MHAEQVVLPTVIYWALSDWLRVEDVFERSVAWPCSCLSLHTCNQDHVVSMDDDPGKVISRGNDLHPKLWLSIFQDSTFANGSTVYKGLTSGPYSVKIIRALGPCYLDNVGYVAASLAT